MYGPPISLAAPLVAAEAEAAPVMARVSASYATFFAGIGSGAAALGKAIYTALGPVGIAFIAAEAIYLLVDHASAEVEKRTRTLLDQIQKAKEDAMEFKRRLNTVDTGGGRDALASDLDDKIKQIQAARDDLAKEVSQMQSDLDKLNARSRHGAAAEGGHEDIEASDKQKALQAQLDSREVELRLLGSLRSKAGELTEEELSRRSVEQAITSEVESQNRALSDMVAKLPSIIAEMQDAARQAKLANDLASQADTTGRLTVLRGERSRIVSEATNAAFKAGDSADTMLGDAGDVTQAVQRFSDRARGGGGLDPAALQAGQTLIDKQKELTNIDSRISAETRSQTEEMKKQADTAEHSKADYDYRLGHAQLITRGEQGAADQMERQHRIADIATKLSKDRAATYGSVLGDATRLYDAEVAAGDAVKSARDAKKDGAKAGREAATAARDEAAETREIANERLRAVQAQGQRIESNPFLFADDKQNLLLANLRQQAAVLQQNNQMASEYIAKFTGGGAGASAQLRASQKELADGVNQLASVQQRMRAMNGSGGIQASLVNWANQFGTAAQQAGKAMTMVLGHAIEGVSNAITGLILGTMTWKQAFSQMASAIISDLVKMAVEFVVQRGVMFLANQIFGKADTASANSQASGAASSWAPAAVAASTATYGVAAAVGFATTVAAMASGAAAGAAMSGVGGGSYEVGGYTGEGAAHEAAGIVHRREYVIDARTLGKAGGPAAFDRMRARINSPNLNSSTAGIGPDSGASRNPSSGVGRSGRNASVLNVSIHDAENQAKRYLDSAQGQRHFVQMNRANRRRSGIRV